MLNRVPIPCPKCHQTVKIRTEYIGQRVQCNRCSHPFVVPRILPVACPECGLGASFRAEDLGRVIRCNRCDVVYEALPVTNDKVPSNQREAASMTGGPCEMHVPSMSNGLHSSMVDDHPEKADSGEDGRSQGLADFEAGRAEGAGPAPVLTTGGIESAGQCEQDWVDEVVRGNSVGPVPAIGESPSPAPLGPTVEDSEDDVGSNEELVEARTQLDRLRVEVDLFRSGACESERLAAECEGLKDQARERSRREDDLRVELEEIRTELERHKSEAAAVRDRAASSARLEEELRAAIEEVARLRADCRDARDAADTATREFEDLLAHSSTLQDGIYQALAEIEKDSTERLIHPREAEQLRARLGELESQMTEAVTARRAVEDEYARTLRAREHELATSREELRLLHAQMRDLAKLEAEEKQLKSLIARERPINDEVAAEVAAFVGAAAGFQGRREARPPVSRPGFAESVRLPGQPAARSTTPARPMGASDGIFALHSTGEISTPELDIALELIDVRAWLPQLMDLRGAQSPEAVPATPDPTIESDVATEPIADRGAPERPDSMAGPPSDVDQFQVESHRLRGEILGLISLGRKKDAEILSLRMVELSRAIAGELSPDFSTWMTVVGQLQAEQGDWAGARSTFDRKNAIFRDSYGELDPRYLNCLASSADALLACGDTVGAEILFQEAETLCRRVFDATHPFATAIRGRLDVLRRRRLDLGSVQIVTYARSRWITPTTKEPHVRNCPRRGSGVCRVGETHQNRDTSWWVSPTLQDSRIVSKSGFLA